MSEMTTTQGAQVTPFKLPGGFVQAHDQASKSMKNDMTARLKQLHANRDTLRSEIYERQMRLANLDMTIDETATFISHLDREALLHNDDTAA